MNACNSKALTRRNLISCSEVQHESEATSGKYPKILAGLAGLSHAKLLKLLIFYLVNWSVLLSKRTRRLKQINDNDKFIKVKYEISSKFSRSILKDQVKTIFKDKHKYKNSTSNA